MHLVGNPEDRFSCIAAQFVLNREKVNNKIFQQGDRSRFNAICEKERSRTACPCTQSEHYVDAHTVLKDSFAGSSILVRHVLRTFTFSIFFVTY